MKQYTYTFTVLVNGHYISKIITAESEHEARNVLSIQHHRRSELVSVTEA